MPHGTVTPEPPDLIDERFEVLELLAVGGFARVYLAQDRTTDHTVAIKWLALPPKNGPDSDEDWSSRFERECKLQRVASGVSGVPAYLGHSVSSSERPWLALEFINGPSLHERVVGNRRRMNDRDVAVFSHQLFTTLSAIHKRGVVHRDLHPANILLGPGDRPYLVDFGISFHEQADRITKTALNIGSLGYRSPERIRATRSHQRASHVQRQRFFEQETKAPVDWWAFGCVVAFSVLGFDIFASEEEALRHSPRLDGLPSNLRDVVDTCLRRNPPATETEIQQALPPDAQRLLQDALSALDRASASGGVSNPSEAGKASLGSRSGRGPGKKRRSPSVPPVRSSNPRARSGTAELDTEAAPIEEYADGHATDERVAAEHNLPPERPPIPRSSRQRGEVPSPPPVRPSAVESMPSDVARIESAGVLSDSREVGQTPQELVKRHSPSSDRPGGPPATPSPRTPPLADRTRYQESGAAQFGPAVAGRPGPGRRSGAPPVSGRPGWDGTPTAEPPVRDVRYRRKITPNIPPPPVSRSQRPGQHSTPSQPRGVLPAPQGAQSPQQPAGAHPQQPGGRQQHRPGGPRPGQNQGVYGQPPPQPQVPTPALHHSSPAPTHYAAGPTPTRQPTTLPAAPATSYQAPPPDRVPAPNPAGANPSGPHAPQAPTTSYAPAPPSPTQLPTHAPDVAPSYPAPRQRPAAKNSAIPPPPVPGVMRYETRPLTFGDASQITELKAVQPHDSGNPRPTPPESSDGAMTQQMRHRFTEAPPVTKSQVFQSPDSKRAVSGAGQQSPQPVLQSDPAGRSEAPPRHEPTDHRPADSKPGRDQQPGLWPPNMGGPTDQAATGADRRDTHQPAGRTSGPPGTPDTRTGPGQTKSPAAHHGEMDGATAAPDRVVNEQGDAPAVLDAGESPGPWVDNVEQAFDQILQTDVEGPASQWSGRRRNGGSKRRSRKKQSQAARRDGSPEPSRARDAAPEIAADSFVIQIDQTNTDGDPGDATSTGETTSPVDRSVDPGRATLPAPEDHTASNIDLAEEGSAKSDRSADPATDGTAISESAADSNETGSRGSQSSEIAIDALDLTIDHEPADTADQAEQEGDEAAAKVPRATRRRHKSDQRLTQRFDKADIVIDGLGGSDAPPADGGGSESSRSAPTPATAGKATKVATSDSRPDKESASTTGAQQGRRKPFAKIFGIAAVVGLLAAGGFYLIGEGGDSAADVAAEEAPDRSANAQGATTGDDGDASEPPAPGIDISAARFQTPAGIVTDGSVVYVSDRKTHVIWRMDLETHKASLLAGTGTAGDSGDGGPATEAQLVAPGSLYLADEILYVADSDAGRVRSIDLDSGEIRTVAGNGVEGDGGDGLKATQASLSPWHVAVGDDWIFISDVPHQRVRRVSLTTGEIEAFSLSVGGAESMIGWPGALAAVDTKLYLADPGNDQVLVVDQDTGEVVSAHSLRDDAGDQVTPWALTAHNGTIYVSDALDGRIYALTGNVSEPIYLGDQEVDMLDVRPAALAVMGDDLLVTDGASQQIFSISLETGEVTNLVG